MNCVKAVRTIEQSRNHALPSHDECAVEGRRIDVVVERRELLSVVVVAVAIIGLTEGVASRAAVAVNVQLVAICFVHDLQDD